MLLERGERGVTVANLSADRELGPEPAQLLADLVGEQGLVFGDEGGRGAHAT